MPFIEKITETCNMGPKYPNLVHALLIGEFASAKSSMILFSFSCFKITINDVGPGRYGFI
jgi:hypothetical protein